MKTPTKIFIPKGRHLFIPTIFLFLGLYVGHNLPSSYDVVIFCIICYYFSVALLWYQVKAGILYQHYSVEAELHEIGALPKQNYPSIKNNNLSFNAEVNYVGKDLRFLRKEQGVASTLLKMKQFGYKVNLTEKYWVVQTKRLTKSELVTIFNKWKQHRVIARTTYKKNATYVVSDWQKLEEISKGKTLLNRTATPLS